VAVVVLDVVDVKLGAVVASTACFCRARLGNGRGELNVGACLAWISMLVTLRLEEAAMGMRNRGADELSMGAPDSAGLYVGRVASRRRLF
jgi:hypothetical protein